MRDTVQPADLSFFSTLAASGSLSAAARELGLTAAAVSKRLTQMESRAGVALVNRTTRRMMLTPEGELYLGHARRILDEIDELSELLGSAKKSPKGLLRVNATLGFGRSPGDFPVCRQIPSGGRAASVVGDAATSHRRCIRRLHPFWRAARYAGGREASCGESASVVRGALVCCVARHAIDRA
jgi:molybdenum-dependent DNA-binding transcriptional regulator ModE